jgi:chorismate mutase
MSDDIEQRLTAAAQAIREYELCGQRCTDLSAHRDEVAAEVAGAREQLAAEAQDVERLEHLSLTRVLAALHHSRDDDLARQRAEAAAAQYKVAAAESRLAAVDADLDQARGRRAGLSGAPQAYADALAEKERQLTHSADPRGAQLLRLADERGRLIAEVGELGSAEDAARAALAALSDVQDHLGSASNWSTYDMVFGGGIVGNAIKHDRMDQAAAAAAEADRRLATLRTDLADLARAEPTGPRLQLSGGLRFADLFFNNIFTDLAVAHQIRDGQDRVARTVQFVDDLRHQLSGQADEANARLAEIDRQRTELLTGTG